MTQHAELYDEIRAVYSRRPSPFEEAAAMRRLAAIALVPDSELTRGGPARRHGARAWSVRVAVAVAVVVVLAGAAIAAPRVIRHFNHADRVDHNVSRLQGPGESMSAAEYRQVQDQAVLTGLELEPVDRSRVLSDGGRTGRLALAPARDGQGFCYTRLVGSSVASGCEPSVDERGVALSVLGPTVVGKVPQQVVGIVVDQVQSVTIVTQDGREVAAGLAGNAFVWTAGTAPERATSIRVAFEDGATATVDIPVGGAR